MSLLPDVTVEVAFTTLPDDPAPVWVDVSSYVAAHKGITIRRGRSGEYSTVTPSQLSLQLDNRDGRFTPERAASPYYPNVKRGRKIRVRARWPVTSGTWTTRFTGFVDQWPTSWEGGSDADSEVAVTASGLFQRLGRRASLRSIIEAEYLADAPVGYWTLGDASGSTTAGPSAGAVLLAAEQIGTGGTIAFASGTGPGTDSLSAPVFTPVDVNNGLRLTGQLDVPLSFIYGANDSLVFEFFVNTSAVGRTILALLDASTGGLRVGVNGAGSVEVRDMATEATYASPYFDTSGATVNDGETHHVVVTFTYGAATATCNIYQDGVLQSSLGGIVPSSGIGGGFVALRVGGEVGRMFAGTLAHLAVYRYTASTMSLARIEAHVGAGTTGFAGDTSDERIARLAGYSHIPTADLDLEVGLSSVVAQETTGKLPLALMQEVEATENGLLYETGDGRIGFHARRHRRNATPGFTLDAGSQDVGADLSFAYDDQDLVNDLTYSRVGGATIRVANQSSIDDQGIYRDDVTSLSTSDNEMRSAANFRLNKYGEPHPRPPQVTVDAHVVTGDYFGDIFVDTFGVDSIFLALLQGELLGSLFTLTGLPSQAPAASVDLFIEGVTEVITDGTYTFTFNTSAGSLFTTWVLGSPTHSQLGLTTTLAY